MLKTSLSAFEGDDLARVAAVSRADDVLDSLFNHIQLYVGAIAETALSEADERRLSAVLVLAINLEHIGDIVEKNLMQMAGKRIRDQRRLPPEALERLSVFSPTTKIEYSIVLSVASRPVTTTSASARSCAPTPPPGDAPESRPLSAARPE